MYRIFLILIAVTMITYSNFAAPVIQITSPQAGESYKIGRTVTIKWNTQGTNTLKETFKFYASTEGPNGPWTLLTLPKGVTELKDVSSDTTKPLGSVNTVFPRKATKNLYLKMAWKNDENVNNVVGPIEITAPLPTKVDSVLTGDITNTITLSSNKIYGLKGIVFVQSGGVLRIEPGTIIMGEIGNTSAICVNRGGIIYANGTPQKPIVMTSAAPPGQRDRGDWGGLLLMGKAKTNLVEAPIEGGIADGQDVKKNGWYGGDDDADSSGVLRFVRVEFAGIAESPDNELNGLTFGAVGNRTVIENVQVSYSGDDSFEWFGGSVNCKRIIAYNGIDDDFDTDNGFRGKVQFGLSKRFADIADQSNSEAYESDNDSKSSERQPFTGAIFSNMTNIGPISDLTMEPGTGPNKYNPKFLTAVQIRRNSRMNLYNSLIVGWPRGVELTNQNTVRAANNDSIHVRYCNFYGIKDETKFFYFPSGTNPDGKVTNDWLSSVEKGNIFLNASGDLDDVAHLKNAFSDELSLFDPSPTADAPYLNNANYDSDPIVDIANPYFDKVPYRGAFAFGERWDLPWAEYDPVNVEYKATSVEDNNSEPAFNLSLYPQPATDLLAVNYYLLNNTNVTLKIIDTYGNVLTTFEQGQQSIGYYNLNINLSTLSNGLYFVQMITNNGFTSQKFVVVK